MSKLMASYILVLICSGAGLISNSYLLNKTREIYFYDCKENIIQHQDITKVVPLEDTINNNGLSTTTSGFSGDSVICLP